MDVQQQQIDVNALDPARAGLTFGSFLYQTEWEILIKDLYLLVCMALE
jgi:hypothetical protein